MVSRTNPSKNLPMPVTKAEKAQREMEVFEYWHSIVVDAEDRALEATHYPGITREENVYRAKKMLEYNNKYALALAEMRAHEKRATMYSNMALLERDA